MSRAWRVFGRSIWVCCFDAAGRNSLMADQDTFRPDCNTTSLYTHTDAITERSEEYVVIRASSMCSEQTLSQSISRQLMRLNFAPAKLRISVDN